MKIKFLRNLGRNHNPAYTDGQVVDVGDDEADKWVKSGLAVAIQAVPPAPPITAPKKKEEPDSGKSDSQKRYKAKKTSKDSVDNG